MFPEGSQCSGCNAPVAPGLKFCEACGAVFAGTPAGELLSVGYLLSELARWEEQGIVSAEQASELRVAYERRREELRAQLAQNGRRAKESAPRQEASAPAWQPPPPPPTGVNYHAGRKATDPRVFSPVAPLPGDSPRRARRSPRRPLMETLADPQTIRLLLYTGAAMLVVGVVIWLRDVLYLKLQEPVVQAALLAIGTIIVTAAGWFTVLRTRLRFTGRALTLTGSLLVPVNFWFLVRSGLVRDQGRAWLVCAVCTLLYAHTAALLREKLYVYLASVASVATAWTLIYRLEPEAFGLYALSLMALSLLFLHLSRLFLMSEDDGRQETNEGRRATDNSNSAFRLPPPAFSYELWGPPLVRVALVGTALALLFYMPLRLGAPPSLAKGIFRLRSGEYDPGVAMLLAALAAYIAWFTGRHVSAGRRALLYATSTLLLFWTTFLATDALALSGSVRLLLLAAATTAVAIIARLAHTEALALALHRASLVACFALSVCSYVVIGDAPEFTLAHSAALAFLAVTYAAASAPRLCEEQAATAVFAYSSALFASVAFLVALVSLDLRPATLFYAACTLWPFALYSVSAAAQHLRRETQLTKPFALVADAEFALLLLFASFVAFALNDAQRLPDQHGENLRGGMFSALAGAVVYGVLRLRRDRSVYGAALMGVAALVLVAATGDALKAAGALPAAWPVATAVVIAAFLMREAAGRLLRSDDSAAASENATSFSARLSRAAVIRLVADSVALACAILWLAILLYDLEAGETSPAAVLFLALLYWVERAARVKRAWPVYLSAAHAGVLCLAVLAALRLDVEWFALASVLVLFPVFFAAGRRALASGADWLARPLADAAGATVILIAVAAVAQGFAHLRVGEPRLLAPVVTFGALALLSFGASLWSASHARVMYFRAGLFTLLASFTLGCLRAGFDPGENIELYTTPAAVLLLAVAYLTARRAWEEYAADTTLLLWLGSLLLAGPLLARALEYRLLLGVPAPWRDLGVLFAALALVLFAVVGRLRAPVLVGATALVLELAALALTSVPWLQIRLWAYLIPVGIFLMLVWGVFEYRRDQLLRLRQRLSERREIVRERFGEWR
jgi:hypothetical protein